MQRLLLLLLVGVSLPPLCFVMIADAPKQTYAQTPEQKAFPDVPSNYWAQPFIQALAVRDIIVGYPDGTYRPKNYLDRDEFAAIINKAFEQPPVRQIASGSVYKDVPKGYWAAPPIEAAYQQGFMSGYRNNYFRPREEVSKVDAIVALNKGLNLAPGAPIATTAAPSAPSATAPSAPSATTQTPPRQARRTKRRFLMFPLAITSLMQPLVVAKANAAAALPRTPGVNQPNTATQPSTSETGKRNNRAVAPQGSISSIVTNTYQDAEKIPQSAIDDVARATQANIVVNYPNPNVLNPNQPINRAEIAALIYQTMVAQGRVKPLPINTPAYQYIVRPEDSNQNAK
ncbi:MAG: S-layer homology domain-containing protein [Scytonema sp. PMC 1069.18]|nr:S-layer homology domain-containing protein [Scytonema sp. PMC 1069.18]MEC4887316.1 S-layer homology domain-containing protein [Scytonema sp. PMC 1070.18]